MNTGPRVVDLRHKQRDPAKRSRVRKGHTVQRDPANVDAIVIHQTTFEIVTARRALRIPAHAVGTNRGEVVLCHPLRSYLYACGVLNRRSLNYEHAGLYSGLLDDPETVPREDLLSLWRGAKRPATELTDLDIETGRLGIRTLFEQGLEDGMPITYILAHRQCARTRRSDPGEALWWALVEDYAVPVLGLVARRSMTWKWGRAIPEAWGGMGRY